MNFFLIIFLLMSTIAFSFENIKEDKELNAAQKKTEEGNYKEAISILEKILISNVKLDQARFQLAVVYNLTRQNKLALKELDKI